MQRSRMVRDSSVYAEMIAEMFVETVAKRAKEASCCVHENEDITPSLMECLQQVYLNGASPVRRIAWGLDISLSAASQLVDRLVKKGLMCRRENQSDRRLAEISLTEAGEELIKEARKRRADWFASVIEAMPKSRRRAFIEGLEGFLRVALSKGENIDRACVRCGVEHVPFCVVSKVKTERSRSYEPGL